MANVGTTTIDFGSTPKALATKTITGQAAIASGSYVEAFLMADSTADHTDYHHKYLLPQIVKLVCGNIVAGTGFTIFATSSVDLKGLISVRWVWS